MALSDTGQERENQCPDEAASRTGPRLQQGGWAHLAFKNLSNLMAVCLFICLVFVRRWINPKVKEKNIRKRIEK